jgi:hypothetical protein
MRPQWAFVTFQQSKRVRLIGHDTNQRCWFCGSGGWTRTSTNQFQGLAGCQLPYAGLW